jgi:alpha-L-rhamnosidase
MCRVIPLSPRQPWSPRPTTLAVFVSDRPIELAPEEANEWRRTKEIDLTAYLEPGANVLGCAVQNTDTGPTGLVAKLVLRGASGGERVLVSGPEWSVTSKADPSWAKRDSAGGADWTLARSYGAYPVGPWGEVRTAGLFLPPPRLLRGSLETEKKPVRRALLYASALGIYDLYLNGARVGEDFFAPGWTDYTKRIPYHAWDVTQALAAGENVLAAVLADGWFAGYIGYGHAREHYGDHTRFLAQLVIEYKDGSRQIAGTGPEWRASKGPWHEADFLMGERYDAREEIAGWDRAGFDASQWAPVDVGAPFPAHLRAHPGPPVRVFAEVPPVSPRKLPNGAWVFDLGQNFAGVVRLRVRGDAGQKIPCATPSDSTRTAPCTQVNLRGARMTELRVRGGGEVGVDAALHVPRFPVRRALRAHGRAAPGRGRRSRSLERRAARGELRVLGSAHHEARAERLLDPARELHRRPDRLPAA